MDKTEQFIKMADCPEIQEEWTIPPHEGDFYKLLKDEVNVWHKKDEYLNQDTLHLAIWLPRQDQIQEMMGKSESCFCIFQIKDGWGGEIIQDREHVFYVATSSPEQVWLAFYFHEKHSKLWSSKEEKWVKK